MTALANDPGVFGDVFGGTFGGVFGDGPASSTAASGGFAFGLAGCCCACSILTDGFTRSDSTDVGSKWTEAAGDWSIATNRLSISDTSARLIAVTPSTQTAVKYSVSVKGGTDGNIARIIFDYVDVDNYKFVQVVFGAGGTLRIYERVAGTETSLKSTSVNVSSASFFTWIVCITSGGGVYSQIDGNMVNKPSVGVTNLEFGLGTGGTVSGAILFDTYRAYVVSQECEQCAAGCSNCYGDEGPAEWLVSIPAGFWTAANCTLAKCEEVEGDFICGYVSGCLWRYDFDDTCWRSLSVSIDISGGVGLATVTLLSGASTTAHSIAWRVEIGAVDGNNEVDCLGDYDPRTLDQFKQTWTVVRACTWDGDTTNTPSGDPFRVGSGVEPITLTAVI